MKNALVYLIVIAGLFIGCSAKKQEITMNDFDRLITADSIESLFVYNDDRVVIKKRSSFGKNEKLVLLIPSAHDFRDKLDTQYPNNKISHVSFIRESGSSSLDLFPILMMAFVLVLFLIAAIDILKNKFASGIEKILWFQLVILVPFVGPIVYLSIGRKQKINFERFKK